MKLLVDNWPLRRWLCWPWCALRRHPDTFWLLIKWHGVPAEQIARCFCGRRQHREPLD